jgi:hypothetical protein
MLVVYRTLWEIKSSSYAPTIIFFVTVEFCKGFLFGLTQVVSAYHDALLYKENDSVFTLSTAPPV